MVVTATAGVEEEDDVEGNEGFLPCNSVLSSTTIGAVAASSSRFAPHSGYLRFIASMTWAAMSGVISTAR